MDETAMDETAMDEQMWHEVVPGLWQGGTPDDEWLDLPWSDGHGVVQDARPFDAVVTLFVLAQPFGGGVPELRFGFPDAHPDHADMDEVVAAAAWAHAQWRSGKRVLVRCQAGWNRSGLVTALVLVLDGWDAADAIARIRETRSPNALCNHDFVAWLLALDPADLVGRARAA
jgi:hypothetical protein